MNSGRNAMNSALALLFLAATAFAQDQSAIATVQAACGPKDVQFDAKKDSSQHPASHDDAGKAIVYFIGDRKGLARPTIRVGVDGVWAGATPHDFPLFYLAGTGRASPLRQLAARP
jgi:hypothetical protein